LDVIREALWNTLGYGVTGKYKQLTEAILSAYEKGEEIDTIQLDPIVKRSGHTPFKNVDGIKFLNHQGGCGGTRQDAATLSALLAAYADHPNVAGITILSLGCQNLQTKFLLEDIRLRNPAFDKPLLVFEQQQSQSEEQLI